LVIQQGRAPKWPEEVDDMAKMRKIVLSWITQEGTKQHPLAEGVLVGRLLFEVVVNVEDWAGESEVEPSAENFIIDWLGSDKLLTEAMDKEELDRLYVGPFGNELTTLSLWWRFKEGLLVEWKELYSTKQ
jgi:hypothetical protein